MYIKQHEDVIILISVGLLSEHSVSTWINMNDTF